jgi:hypothetical protein
MQKSKVIRKRNLYIIPCVLYSAFFGNCGFCFSNFSGRGEGLAGSYSALASGFDAVFYNPANLAISPNFSFNISTLGIEYNSNLSLGEYIKIYNKRYINEQDKKMFDEGENLGITGTAQAISFSFKNFAFVTYPYTKNEFKIPTDITDLIFWGNERNREYSFEGVKGESEIGFAAAFSMAWPPQKWKNFAFGTTIKYFQGFYYMKILDSHGSLTTVFNDMSEETEIHGNGELVYRKADSGYGLGLDFGMLYSFKNYNIGLSVIDAYSGMVWDKGTKAEASFVLDSTDVGSFDPESTFKWKEKKYEEHFVTHSNPTIRLGGALKGEKVALSSEVGYPQLFSIGIERLYPLIILRVGMAFVDSRCWYGCGLGIRRGLLNLDIGMRVSSPSHISGALSLWIGRSN